MLCSRITSSIFCVRRLSVCRDFQGARKTCSARSSEMIRNYFLLDSVVFQDRLKYSLCEKTACLYRFWGCLEKMLRMHIRNDSKLMFVGQCCYTCEKIIFAPKYSLKMTTKLDKACVTNDWNVLIVYEWEQVDTFWEVDHDEFDHDDKNPRNNRVSNFNIFW